MLPNAGRRGRVLSPDDLRRTTAGVAVWCAPAGAATARMISSAAVRLIDGRVGGIRPC